MSIADDLARLAELRKSGDLTDDQYLKATDTLLAGHANVEPDYGEPLELAPPAPKKKKRRLLGLGWGGWAVAAFVGFIIVSFSNYESSAEQREKLRTADPVAYAELIAKEEADAAAKAERDRVAAEQRQTRDAEAAEAQRVAQGAKAAEEAEEKRKGFHCLSGWDGSQRAVVDWTKENLNDPSSFEHDETRIAPVDAEGNHTLIMDYRAKNGFGGVVRGSVMAKINSSSCALVEVISST
ncbi:MAG: hypothetical protein ACOH2N_11295 [Devosia sp.]